MELYEGNTITHTEWHDGVRAQICRSFWFDRSKNKVLETGKWSLAQIYIVSIAIMSH